MASASDAPATRRRVILVSGPSGAGKSRLCASLAAQHGWPIVRLDDFYRDGDDPSLPMSDLGIPDWDHVDSWRAEDAAAALAQVVDTGRTQTPDYDISLSKCVGYQTISAAPQDLILAEGIFAADLAPRLRQDGLLADAWCVRRTPLLTFGLRLARDLKERRKPPLTLLRRGLTLMRAEPQIVARQVELGATAVTPAQARARLTRLTTMPTPVE